MEGFTYYNAFDTKGFEYLAILAFFALLIPFWVTLNRKVKVQRKLKQALGILSANGLKVPQGLFYSKNHTWAHLGKSGSAKVGLDDLLLHITGQVQFSHLLSPGATVRKGDLMTEISHEGKTLRIYAPVSGTILQTNPLLTEDPAILNEDPYGQGWIYAIKPENWISETSSFYLAGAASEWVSGEVARFKDFIAESARKHDPEPAMIVLQDGGEVAVRALAHMPRETWDEFQQEFLNMSVEK
jgi:glycine cleavage system H protein